MKNIKKVAYIIIILLIVSFIGGLGYKYYLNNQIVTNFTDVLANYKQELSTYDLSDKAEENENLIKECEQAINNKDSNEIKNLNVKLDTFKEELLNKNMDMTNSKVSELESIDISKLEDKDSIVSKIEEIKKLREEKKFIQANELIATLNNDINSKLEIVKQEEAKKNEEEAIKNIEGTYRYEKLNKNGVFLEGYDLSIVIYNENKLIISGNSGVVINIISSTNISLEEATKEDEGSANLRSGIFEGTLDYSGNLVWNGFIWDDRSEFINITGDDGYIAKIPIEISIDKENNDNIIVSLGDKAWIKGTKTLTKIQNDELRTNYLKEKKKEFELNENKISEREALELVEINGFIEDNYTGIKVSSKYAFDENEAWGLPDEEYYTVIFIRLAASSNYLVGKESGKVYFLGKNAFGHPAKLMKDGNVIEEYDYIGE